MIILDRRQFLIGTGLLGVALSVPAFALEGPGPETVDLAISAARSTKLFIWRPAMVKGVALLSTGHGSWPERYTRLIDLLTANGFAILAPVHVDSMHYPDRDKFTMQASFGERLADMKATGAYAAKAFPDLPTIAVGHSFGTLISLCLGGALAYIGPFRNPAVKAVLGFSSPGKIPGLIQPTAYASLAVPALIVTGTKDLVPGFVTDPADHLFPIESAPAGGKYGLVVADGEHRLVDDAAGFARAAPAVSSFVDGYGLDNATARARLKAFQAAPGDRFIVRETAS